MKKTILLFVVCIVVALTNACYESETNIPVNERTLNAANIDLNEEIELGIDAPIYIEKNKITPTENG